MTWHEIPGWFSEDDAAALLPLVRGQTVLEIGSFLGRSTALIASAAAHVFSLDWHYRDRHTESKGPPDTLPDLRRHIVACGLMDRVTILCGRVETLAAHLAGPFGCVFVDGAHDADSVERDTRLALRLVAPGGVVAWHDMDEPGVELGAERAGVADWQTAPPARVAWWRAPA